MDRQMKIAIIGGGPGGLTLARILQLKGFKCVTVYERDESRFVRGQGGSLDLHENTGQYALKTAELMNEFKEHCRYEGQDTRIQDKDGVTHIEEIATDENNDRPEIDRSSLRDILLDSLAPDTVKWGHTLTSLEQLANGKVQLNFRNGATAEADFVAGADGTWSKVRPHLSSEQPIYTGITLIEFELTDVDNSYPEVSKFVGRGQVFGFAEGRAIMAQRNSNGVIRVYAGIQVPEDYVKNQDFDFTDVPTAKAFLLNHYPEWNDQFLNMIRENSGEFIPRLMYALPVAHSWPRDPDAKDGTLVSRITILGDAAHVMPIFAAQGANLAMLDAAKLAAAIDSPKEDFQSSLAKYEAEMFVRSEIAAKQSADNLEMFFGPNGAIEAAKLMDEVKARMMSYVKNNDEGS